MPRYECPSCNGGFPELDDNCCPWCGKPAEGSDSKVETPNRHPFVIEPTDRAVSNANARKYANADFTPSDLEWSDNA